MRRFRSSLHPAIVQKVGSGLSSMDAEWTQHKCWTSDWLQVGFEAGRWRVPELESTLAGGVSTSALAEDGSELASVAQNAPSSLTAGAA